ncbi:unnamed protein product [Danaus chrysippus]|uniref:(African queen) hypothetical protein n=1 Tax=Danaus chrysippus TaxID=151541 RepID=A0A8J2WAT1_9NEOP|nr:unnamed protein product [Danaus chrysippus]
MQDSDIEDESDAEDPRNKEADVRQWLEETADTVPPKEHDAHAFPKELMETPEKECIQTQSSAAVKPDQQPAGTKDLAEAIIRAIQSVPKGGASVPSYVTELPFFDRSREDISYALKNSEEPEQRRTALSR